MKANKKVATVVIVIGVLVLTWGAWSWFHRADAVKSWDSAAKFGFEHGSRPSSSHGGDLLLLGIGGVCLAVGVHDRRRAP